MSELRIKFERDEEVKYISHLDILKLFERTIRRADIKVTYSKGFNPHVQIVFGLPMGVGLSSICEYADITLEGDMEPQAFIDTMNGSLPQGIRVIDAKVKTTKGNIMAQLEAASYEVIVYVENISETALFFEKLHEFMAKDIIMLLKENKNGKKYVDIRSLILENNVMNHLELNKSGENKSYYQYNMLLRSGQLTYLKPENVVRAFNEFSGFEQKIFKIKRTGSFALNSGKLVSPMDDLILLQPR